MVHIRKFYLFLTISALFFSKALLAIFPINIFRPYDINMRPPTWPGTCLQTQTFFEIGFQTRAQDGAGESVNELQLWQPTQDALAMLKGFPASDPKTIFLNDVLGDPADNGIQGHVRATGDFTFNGGVDFAMRYHAPHNITVGLYLPLYFMQLRNVRFEDLTPEETDVKQDLTDQLVERIRQFDPLLNLQGWKRWGVGDLAFIAEWLRDFSQQKPILNNVALNARLGLTFPTGLTKNENDIFSIPFGFDGSVGLLFGGGIYLTWIEHLRGGLYFEFLHLFGNTHEQRIKVNPDQTELLFLAKVPAHRNFGFTQQYNLFLEGYRLFNGLSLSVAYQFWRHGDDSLSLCTNEFSELVANTAESLEEWTIHQGIFKAGYDFAYVMDDQAWFKPQVSAFVKYPFNGKRALLISTAGLSLTLNF